LLLRDAGRQRFHAEGLAQRLRRRLALEPVPLVAPLEIGIREEAIQIALGLGRREIPGLPSLHAEALVEQRAVHPLDEAVRPR